jgi:diaminopimelate decarboxylase
MREGFRSKLLEAAQTFGTPLYAYDWREVETRARAVLNAFSSDESLKCRVFYAMKANPNLNLLRRMREGLGLGFEACSGGELERAVRAGAPGTEIVLHGPGKLDQDHARALEIGATIMLDAPGEVERVARSAPGAHVMVRVNPGLTVHTHDHLATGNAASKFGVRVQDVPDMVHHAERAGLEVLGLHMHIGSAIEEPSDYAEALERVSNLASELGARPVFDMGGGFGLDFDLGPLAQLGREAAARFQARELWLEPGRWLVARAGVLLTTVLEVKETGRRFAAVDAGMSELIRPMLYGAKHAVISLAPERNVQTLDLAGPACESGDVLARDVSIPAPERGDVLTVLEAGAYGSSMSSTYLTRSRPAEVLLEDGVWKLIRRRETMDELLLTETV